MAVTPHMAATGVKLIRNQNIRPNKFDDSSIVFLDPSFAESHSSKTVRQNDVVIVRTGSNIGDACVVPEHFDGSQSFTTLTVRPNAKRLSPQYLAQFINSSFGRSEVDRLMAGGAKGNLNAGELERFRIKIPPLDQQRRISELLGNWDASVEKIEQLIAAKERKRLWLSRKLLTKKPHWKKCKLKNFFAEIRDLHGDGDFPVGSIGKRGIGFRNEIYSKNLSEKTSGNILVRNSSICFGLASDSIVYGVNLSNVIFSVSPAYRTFQLQDVDCRFMDNYLRVFNKKLSGRFLITSARQGKAIDFDGLLNEPCYFPELKEQIRISDALDANRLEIEALKSLSMQYKNQKRGLTKNLLTGSWR